MQSWIFVAIIATLTPSFARDELLLLDIHNHADTHNTVIKGVNLFQQTVPYANHPYDPSSKAYFEGQETDNTQRRRTLSESETSPIRISAYYDPDTITNTLSADQQQHIEELIGAIGSYYEQFVKVIPIDGTYFTDRQCQSYYETPFGETCTSYDIAPSCQGMSIPSDHLAQNVIYNADGSMTVQEGGVG